MANIGDGLDTPNLFGDAIITRDEFLTYRGYILLLWIAFGIFSMLVAGIERTLFGVMGERLSY